MLICLVPRPFEGRGKGLVHTECTYAKFFCKIHCKTYNLDAFANTWLSIPRSWADQEYGAVLNVEAIQAKVQAFQR